MAMEIGREEARVNITGQEYISRGVVINLNKSH